MPKRLLRSYPHLIAGLQQYVVSVYIVGCRSSGLTLFLGRWIGPFVGYKRRYPEFNVKNA